MGRDAADDRDNPRRPADEPTLASRVGPYVLQQRLGAGGMGEVYRALDTRLRRPVALKFLTPALARDVSARTRFMHEARAASVLDHPNICTVHEIGEHAESLYVVMPCYEGETLTDRIQRGPLPVAAAVEIAIQVARGLAKAHQRGIVHRDLKPSNLFITDDGVVKIIDFGLAKLAGRTALTRTGTILGTVAYMSPEQARGEPADHRSDIWSLGVVLHEMLAGQRPFAADHEQAVLYAIMNGRPEPVRRLRPEVPVALERVVGEMLEKDAGRRFDDASEVVSALQSIERKLAAAATAPEIAPGGPAAARSVPSIAVLPFANLSPDPENRYFGDGLAEELINALAQIEGLRVASRTSSFRFLDKEVDAREIGEALGVATLLEGSVRRAGNRLRITAQLIDIKDGYHLWSKRFDREMEDIFAVQDEIARAIVEQLKVRLVGDQDEAVMKFGTENLEAYTALLEGRYHLHSLTPEGWQKGFELLERSIALDPGFALPHAWLSMYYQSLAWWGDSAPHDVMPRSREAADRAVELADDLGFAHNNRGVIHFSYDWDFAAAEESFLRGLKLDPASGYGHMSTALFYACRGRSEEAVAEARLALKLEPLDGLIAAWIVSALTGAGAVAEAIDVGLRALKLAQEHWQLRMFLGSAYLLSGRAEEAAGEYRKAIALSGEASIALAESGVCCYLTGNAAEGDALARRLVARSGDQYVPPSLLARLEIARGDIAAARAYLERAIAARDLMLVTEAMWPPEVRMHGTELEPLLRSAGLALPG